MNISSARALSITALAAIAACIASSPVMAGGGPGCPHNATLTQDVEGNGQMTAAAHMAGAAKRFESMDINKDGKVTAAEINGSRGAESLVWANEHISAVEKVKTLDANNDGTLTAKEYADGSQQIFNKLDVDGDGVLSAAEADVPSKVSAR